VKELEKMPNENESNKVKKAELLLEIVGKAPKKIKVNHEKLEVKKGDKVIWKKQPKDKFSYKIIFSEHSPFTENEFPFGSGGDSGEQTVVYDHLICGWKRFKYVIIASDGTDVLFSDPELIIPKNARQ
jgi:hypothetical protein